MQDSNPLKRGGFQLLHLDYFVYFENKSVIIIYNNMLLQHWVRMKTAYLISQQDHRHTISAYFEKSRGGEYFQISRSLQINSPRVAVISLVFQLRNPFVFLSSPGEN